MLLRKAHLAILRSPQEALLHFRPQAARLPVASQSSTTAPPISVAALIARLEELVARLPDSIRMGTREDALAVFACNPLSLTVQGNDEATAGGACSARLSWTFRHGRCLRILRPLLKRPWTYAGGALSQTGAIKITVYPRLK